jgi:hypothetical protein
MAACVASALVLAHALLAAAAAAVYDAALGSWMWQLFRNGPLWLGCWGGLPDVDVCSRIAGASAATDWQASALSHLPATRCTALIHRTYVAFATVVHTALYVALAAWAARRVLNAVAAAAHSRCAARPGPGPGPCALCARCMHAVCDLRDARGGVLTAPSATPRPPPCQPSSG